MKIMIGFIIGMLFQHSLTGEYSRYGMEVNDEITMCERKEGQECDIIVAPIHYTTEENTG